MEISIEIPESEMANDYDVFLSFRGPDTRNNFADILYQFMSNEGIRVFRDDEESRPGEKITEILHAIKRSRLYMPILSKGYASSKWCLRELVHMVECTSDDQPGRGLTTKKEILPIFYDVEPNDVKLKTELYNEALRMHERKGCDCQTVESWREALRSVAGIKGWHLKDQGQGIVLNDIIQQVHRKIATKKRVVSNNLVGIADQVEAIQELLSCDIADVKCVIIHGMGGIGKTTLATEVFNQLCTKFQHCSFLSNIRESFQRGNTATVQKKLLSDIFNFSFRGAFELEGCHMLQNRLPNKRVFIVFDDVDDADQLRELVRHFKWFGPESRIIITTRNTSIFHTIQEALNGNVITQSKKIHLYEMKELDTDHALQLFSMHAFGTRLPPQDYHNLSREVLVSTGGLPLAIEVIGSSLRARSKETWESTLKKLKGVPHEKVREKLKISYDALAFEPQQIFLDITCFFVNKKKTNAIFMWEACKFYPQSELEVLVDKSLIKIVDRDRLWIHDQLRDLGRDIVRQEDTIRLGNPSRLWLPKRAQDIIGTKKGTENVMALALQRTAQDFTYTEFRNLLRIRYLEMDGGNYNIGGFWRTLQELRRFCWNKCPLKLQADNFMLRNLVVLKLSNYSTIEDWSGWAKIREARTLKVLKLTGFKFSVTLDFSMCLSLERLVLKDCPCLAKIDRSIGKLERLVHLKIKFCSRLQKLPEEIGCLTSLRDLILIQGYSIKALPHSIGNLKLLSRLVVEDSALALLPHTIEKLVHLKYLSLVTCTELTQLPPAVGGLTSLIELDLSGSAVGDLPLSLLNVKNLMVKINSNPIRQRLKEGLRSNSSLPELIQKDLSHLRFMDYPISQLISCGVIQKEYSDLQICIIPKTESPSFVDIASEIPRSETELRRSLGENSLLGSIVISVGGLCRGMQLIFTLLQKQSFWDTIRLNRRK